MKNKFVKSYLSNICCIFSNFKAKQNSKKEKYKITNQLKKDWAANKDSVLLERKIIVHIRNSHFGHEEKEVKKNHV